MKQELCRAFTSGASGAVLYLSIRLSPKWGHYSLFNAFFFTKFTEVFTYELRSIVSSDTNRQSERQNYLLETCNDFVSICRPQDFYFHITTVVVHLQGDGWSAQWPNVLCAGRRIGPGSSPARGIALCSWVRHFTLIVPPSTQVYKWVPANLLLWATLRWTSIPFRGGSRILLVASCYGNRDELRPEGPLGSYADFIVFTRRWSPDGRDGVIRSAEICCHGSEGSSILLRSSGGLGILTIWQGWQVLQNISASLSYPSHHTLVRSVHFMDNIPGYSSCARCRTLSRKLEGMIIRVPRSSNFPITVTSKCRLF